MLGLWAANKEFETLQDFFLASLKLEISNGIFFVAIWEKNSAPKKDTSEIDVRHMEVRG